MPKRSLWKLLFISFFAFLVVACKPIASFSVSPDPLQAGVEATFDASSTVIYNKPKDNAAKSYAWDFGDGSAGNGKVVTHTYAAAGTFEVKLTVVDTAGRVGTSTEKLVVTPGDVVADPTTTELKVLTQIAGGVSLPGAEVTVGSVSATSDTNGLATLDTAPVGVDQVVTVKKDGYVTQSIRASLTSGDEPRQLLVLLMPEKDTLNIDNIAEAQAINSNYLGASVTLPANALVNASTNMPAMGAATLKLTPWDISGIDLQAMPGNGRARDASGNLVDLISAGMMTVDFFDAAGNKLQVAPGKTATIQMDLPQGTVSIGGTAMVVGAAIPLWHFDEAQGLWIEEGTGSVVATATGLAVQATVSHFSSWNWDIPIPPIDDDTDGDLQTGSGGGTPPAPMTISCQGFDGAVSACDTVAEITLTDGSKLTRSASLPAAVTAVIRMPANATVQWTATTPDGLVGTATTGTTGNWVIQLSSPAIVAEVSCSLPSGVPVACEASMTVPLTDGTTATLTRYLPAEGGQFISNLATQGPLQWTARTSVVLTQSGQWQRYSGASTSTTVATVNIPLLDEQQFQTQSFYVQCGANAQDMDGTLKPLLDCNMTISFVGLDGTPIDTVVNVPNGLNGITRVDVPEVESGVQIQIRAFGTDASGTPFGASELRLLNDIGNNGTLTLQLGRFAT